MPRDSYTALALVLALAACRQPAPSPVVRAAGEPTEAAVSVRAAPDLVARAPVVDATPEAGADAAAPAAARAGMALERVEALDAQRVMAYGNGELYRLAGDHWARLRLEGAEARDVVATRGALWVLAGGTGANAGRALILRSTNGETLVPVSAPLLGAASEPRALAVVRDGEYYVGGAQPALVHVTGDSVVPVPTAQPQVRALRWLRDEVLVADHGGGHFTILRWGEQSTAEMEDYLDTVTDPGGFGFLVHRDGTVVRGRPGREISAVAPAAPFAPRVAAILANGRPAVAGSGSFATWTGRAWQLVPGAFPREPVALLPTQPPIVVGRSGETVAVEAEGPRAVVTATR